MRLLYVGAGSHRMHGFIHAEMNIWKEQKLVGKGGSIVPAPEMLCDITDRIPLADNSVDFIFSRDTLEHLTYRELVNHLLECYRILKLGGLVRACLPDFDKHIRDYRSGLMETGTEFVEPNPDFPVRNFTEYFIYQMMYEDHRYLHNEKTMSDVLALTGFTKMRTRDEGISQLNLINPQLREAEAGWQKDHLIIEASKGDIAPTAVRYQREYPRCLITRLFARYLNIRVSPFLRNRPMFPTRYWIRDLIRRVKQKYR